MKPYDNDDELDRALFALDLEEPPADLRASILAATIYRPAPARAVEPTTVWFVGGMAALVAWLLIMALQGAGAAYVGSAQSTFDRVVAGIFTPENVMWAAAGGAVAVWLSQLNLTLAPGALQTRRR